MRRPYNGTYSVTRPYGIVDPAYADYPGSRHPGTDYGLPYNTPQVAAINGMVHVIARGDQPTGRGNEVVIYAGNTETKHCHLNVIHVAEGQIVKAGQQIGLTGYTGYVLPKSPAGSHLHFEVLINGQYIDPETQYKEEIVDKITKEQEILCSIMQTGSKPGRNYDYRFTGLPLTQLNLDKMLQFWSVQKRPNTEYEPYTPPTLYVKKG